MNGMELLHDLIGRQGEWITWWQMTLRALIVFAFGLALVRIFGQRAFGRHAALDIILAIMIGSNLSRALTGNAPFFATLAGTTGLVLFYWISTLAAARWHGFSWLVKGDVAELVRDGEMKRQAMRRLGISEGDVQEAMRRQGVKDLRDVRLAMLERNGNISIVRA